MDMTSMGRPTGASDTRGELSSRRAFLRRALLAGALLPVAGSLLEACSSPAPASAPTAATGGSAATSAPAVAASPAGASQAAKPSGSTKDTITIAQGQDAIALDPTQHTTYPTGNILWHIYEPLVRSQPGGKYAPLLATEWKTLNDTTWQFKLRQGVTFHNGEPFDANAVKFSFDRAMDPAIKNRTASYLRAIDHVDIVDPYTVNFVTKGPYPVLLYGLSENAFSAMILAPKYVQEKGADAFKQPVGTGPYTFVSWAKDESLKLRANPSYWAGAPAIKNVVFRPIPETAAQVAELKSGGADLIDAVTPEQAETLKSGSTRVATVPSDFVMFVAMNTMEPGPLQDKRVRQALNHAVDVDAIVKNVMGGLAQKIEITLPRDAVGYPQNFQGYPYDPAKAKQLLSDAGHGNGFKVPFISRNGRYLKDKEVVEAVAGYLSQVGVQCDIQLLTGTVWSQISDKHERHGLSYPGWSGPDAQLVWDPILHSGGLQSYVENKQIDDLIDRGRVELDETKRKGIYADLANLLKDEAVHIPLFQPPLIYGLAANLSWTPKSNSVIDLRDAKFT